MGKEEVQRRAVGGEGESKGGGRGRREVGWEDGGASGRP